MRVIYNTVSVLLEYILTDRTCLIVSIKYVTYAKRCLLLHNYVVSVVVFIVVVCLFVCCCVQGLPAAEGGSVKLSIPSVSARLVAVSSGSLRLLN